MLLFSNDLDAQVSKLRAATNKRETSAAWALIHPQVEAFIRDQFVQNRRSFTEDNVQDLTMKAFVMLTTQFDPTRGKAVGFLSKRLHFAVTKLCRRPRKRDYMDHLTDVDDETLEAHVEDTRDDEGVRTSEVWAAIREARDDSEHGSQEHRVLSAASDWLALRSMPEALSAFTDDPDTNSFWRDVAAVAGTHQTEAKQIVRDALKDEER